MTNSENLTPAKKTLIQFLKYWKKGNKKQMYSRTSKTWQSLYDKNAFKGTGLESFEIESEKQNGPVCDFKIKLNDEPHTVRSLCETAGYIANVKGTWGVFPASFRKVKK